MVYTVYTTLMFQGREDRIFTLEKSKKFCQPIFAKSAKHSNVSSCRYKCLRMGPGYERLPYQWMVDIREGSVFPTSRKYGRITLKWIEKNANALSKDSSMKVWKWNIIFKLQMFSLQCVSALAITPPLDIFLNCLKMLNLQYQNLGGKSWKHGEQRKGE
jgi:hypothetical protein